MFRTFRIQAGELFNARNEILLHERLRHHVLLAGLKENRQVFELYFYVYFFKKCLILRMFYIVKHALPLFVVMYFDSKSRYNIHEFVPFSYEKINI